MRPTLDVNGMWGGYIGAGSKTVIPNEAFAKLTMRLVPGQDPQGTKQAVINHLRAHLPLFSTLEIYADRGQAGAYAVPLDHPLLGAAPNEFFRLSSVTDGLAAWVQIIRQISQISPDAFAPYRRG